MSNNNSNNLHPMERVLYQIHHKVCTFALRRTTTQARRWLERLWLLLFVAGFAITMILHVSFVYRDTTTLDGRPLLHSIPLTCLRSIRGFGDADITHLYLLRQQQRPPDEDDDSNSNDNNNKTTTSWAFQIPAAQSDSINDNANTSERAEDDSCTVVEQQQQQQQRRRESWEESFSLAEYASDIYFSYSKVKGYLYLTAEQCLQHNITVQHVLVSPTDEHCFGEPFLQNIIFHLTAQDTVMINWLLGTFSAKGYIYNPRSQTLLDPGSYHHLQQQRQQHKHKHKKATTLFESDNHQHQHQPDQLTSSASLSSLLLPFLHQQGYQKTVISKLTVVCKTTFLFFIVTTLVAFILRETQERMLEFTRQLQVRVRSHRPVAHLVTTHVVENLVFVPIMVGMIFFLIEFYDGDKIAAFMVMSIVWVCEAFSVVSLRSSEGMYFFPRIFFLEFSMFHFYFFMFPCGFSYLALASTACCMIHSMLFFWHRYELPAVALGHVTADYPRMGAAVAAAMTVANNGTYANIQSNIMPSPSHNIGPEPSSSTPLRSNRHSSNSSSSSNNNNDDTYDGVPLPPMARLPPRPSIARQHSLGAFSTSSQGRMSSRYPSSTGLFRPGDEYGDDEDSAIYFMDGEVVMHRPPPVAARRGRSHGSSTDETDTSQQSSSHSHDRMIPVSISTEQPQQEQPSSSSSHGDDPSSSIGHHQEGASQLEHDSLLWMGAEVITTTTATATPPPAATATSTSNGTPRVDNRMMENSFVNGGSVAGLDQPVLEDSF